MTTSPASLASSINSFNSPICDSPAQSPPQSPRDVIEEESLDAREESRKYATLIKRAKDAIKKATKEIVSNQKKSIKMSSKIEKLRTRQMKTTCKIEHIQRQIHALQEKLQEQQEVEEQITTSIEDAKTKKEHYDSLIIQSHIRFDEEKGIIAQNTDLIQQTHS